MRSGQRRNSAAVAAASMWAADQAKNAYSALERTRAATRSATAPRRPSRSSPAMGPLLRPANTFGADRPRNPASTAVWNAMTAVL